MTISGSQTLRSQPAVPVIGWLAGADAIGHAQPAGDARTLCGRPATLLRYAHPETSRCAECVAIVEARR